MLPAAWRKMWVRRVVGTDPEAISSANGLPAPTGASWSASPTSTTCALGPTARSRVTSSSRLAIEVSSTISRSQEGVVLIMRGSLAGDPAQGGVDGCGAHPARLVHADRGAAGRGDQQHPGPAAAAAVPIARIDAVLPVPGPPVISDRRWASAFSTPWSCSGVRWSCSSLPFASRGRGRRRRSPVGPESSSWTRSASSASSSAVGSGRSSVRRRGRGRRRRPARRSRFRVRLSASSRCRREQPLERRQVLPSRSASDRTCRTAARVRCGLSGAMPST